MEHPESADRPAEKKTPVDASMAQPAQAHQPERSFEQTVDAHVADAVSIMHGLGPYQRMFSLEQIDKSEAFQRVRTKLDEWARAIEPAQMRKEAALTLPYRLDWATGATYLRYDETSGTFSFRSIEADRRQFEGELKGSVDAVLREKPELTERIRESVAEWNRHEPQAGPEMIDSLLSFVAEVERECPSLRTDLPGWAGNSMIDFLSRFKEATDGQNNCVRESRIVAEILTNLQAKNLLPDSIRILKYDHSPASKQVTLSAADGTEENHVGTKLILGEDGAYFIDTWNAEAGQKGAAYANMKDWHDAFSEQSDQEKALLGEMQDGLTLPSGAEGHHPEHDVKWDFIFLRFFADENREIPQSLGAMFEYMQKMCAHYVIEDYRQEKAVGRLFNTPRGRQSLGPHVREYFSALYPRSQSVKDILAKM